MITQINNEQEKVKRSYPLIGEKARPFTAKSTLGEINFPEDYPNKWILLLFYPEDFSAVGSSEFIGIAKNLQQYLDLNVQPIAVGLDSMLSHFAWFEEIYKLEPTGTARATQTIPLISDEDKKVSNLYGVIGQENGEPIKSRSLFLIDPNRTIKYSSQYSDKVGRGGEEIRRVIKAMQKTYEENIATPVNWQPGDDVLLLNDETFKDVLDTQRRNVVDENIECPAWFICYKKDDGLPVEQAPVNEQNGSLFENGYTTFNNKIKKEENYDKKT